MRAGETLRAADGYEVALFPLPYLYMTQDEGGDTSHQGTYNLDFSGRDASGKLNNAPIYAPVTMKVVAFWNTEAGGHQVTFESVDPVHLADGSIDYLTIAFAHDPNPPVTNIGAVVAQGDLCYHTGEYGIAYGDHVHTCAGKGQYIGYTTRSTGHMDLTNRIHYWNAVYVNDTIIEQGYNHDWKIWIDPTPEVKKRRFPWVIYINKIRDEMST